MSCFGGQTVTFVSVSATGSRGYAGLKAKARSETVVGGCHFRPASVAEAVGQTDVATQVWKCTAPPAEAVLNAKPNDEVKVGDVTYQIDGPIMPKYDPSGVVDHVTIMCKRQAG